MNGHPADRHEVSSARDSDPHLNPSQIRDREIRTNWESGRIYPMTFLALIHHSVDFLMRNGGPHMLADYGVDFHFLGQRDKFEEEFAQWVADAADHYDANDPLAKRDILTLLLASGMLTPILWEDWGIDRDAELVAKKFGITHFHDLQNVLASRVQGKHAVLHLGSGDQSLVQELICSNAREGMEWQHIGVGDRLYFSLERIFHGLTLDDPELHEFVKIFCMFVTREFRKEVERTDAVFIYPEKRINLNDVYKILRNAHEWIRQHYDAQQGKYKGSEEFEQDSDHYAFGRAKQLMERICRGEDLSVLYREVFKPELAESICQTRNPINLNLTPGVFLKGFVYGKFQNISDFVPEKAITLAISCRGDSHLNDDDYFRLVYNSLVFLKPGGVYLSDGVRESYTRVLRYDRILALIQDLKGQFRAFAVVNRSDQQPFSLYMERGVFDGKGYHFLPDEELAKCFDISEVELVPLADIVQREDLRLETAYRRSVLREFHGDRKVFAGKNDLIHQAVKHVCEGISDADLLIRRNGYAESVSENDEVISHLDAFREILLEVFDMRESAPDRPHPPSGRGKKHLLFQPGRKFVA